MSAANIILWVGSRASHAESIEVRHAEVAANMARIGAPLGWHDLAVPPAPDCGDQLRAVYTIKYPVRGLRFIGDYVYRGERYVYGDEASFDDMLRFGFKTSNKALDYRAIVHEHLPRVVEAFRGYRAFVGYDGYDAAHAGGYVPSDDGSTAFDETGYQVRRNPIYNALCRDSTIDIDGRNNIFTLRPAHYWDAELCQRALGYGRDEVIRRLQGKVPRVEPLMDGVYVVFNDDPALSYEAFVQINECFKPLLGLI